jgi:dTDP-4-amino-4,6-dideoxygalactose transaminase
MECKEEIDAAMAEVITKSSFINGPAVKLFEAELAESIGVKHAVGCNSATAAGWMLLKALGLEPGDNVVTTPHTAVATAEYMTMIGARPKFADIDPRTYQLCPKAAEAAIDSRTRAIMPVHLYGIPVNMDAFLELGRKYNLPVIEDCAQAQGAEWKGKRIGSMGIAGCFSFFPSKNLGGFGDSGALVTNDDQLARYVRMFRDHGRESKYIHDFAAANERLDTLHAAILRVKLKQLDRWNAHRRAIADRYAALLADVPEVTLPEIYEGSTPVWHLFVIRAERRDDLEKYLKEKGIGTGRHYPLPLHLQPAMSEGYKEGDLPEAERACREILSLPMGTHMPLEQVDQVVAVIREFYGRK